MVKRMAKLTLFMVLLFISGCSSYKTTWDCPKAQGIGCSSIEYADEVAREMIILNKSQLKPKKIIIRPDILEDELYEEVVIN
jgi:hypothetical protein